MQPHGGVCMMFGCPNHRKMKNGPSFYRFPKNKEICLKWVEKCKRDDLREMFVAKGPEYISKNHSLCSHHFTTKDFRNNNKPTQGVCPGAVPSVKIHGEEDEPGVSNANAKMKVNLHCPIYFSSPSPSPSPESSPCQSPVLSKKKKLETKKPEIQSETEMIEIEVKSVNQQENNITNMKKDVQMIEIEVKSVNQQENNITNMKKDVQMIEIEVKSINQQENNITNMKKEVQMMIEECPPASPDLLQSDIKPVKPSKQLRPMRFPSESPDLSQTQARSLELPCTSPDLSQAEVNPVKRVDTVKSFKRTKPTTLEDYKELLKKSRLLATTYRLRCKTYKNKILRMKKKIEAKRQENL